MRLATLLLLFALLFLTLTAPAQAPPPPVGQTVYAGGGRVLEVSATRQLSVNARVSQFLYQPGSLEIAYCGTEQSEGGKRQFVELVGPRRGRLATLLSQTQAAGTSDNPYSLIGWDADGRFLLVQHREWTHSPDGTEEDFVPVWDSVDVGVTPFAVRRVPLPADNVNLSNRMTEAPSGRQFAIGAAYAGVNAARVAYLYDPYKHSVQSLTLPGGSVLVGWTDDAHLLLARGNGPLRQYFSHDTDTGKEAPATNAPAAPPRPPRLYPELTLSVSTLPATLLGPDGLGGADARAVWLRIAGHRKPPPAALLAVSAGAHDPQAVLAPDERSAAWVRDGDLFASEFTLRDATVAERYDAGEELTCAEERGIAEGDLKQIGLALKQYAQDYDETLPPPESFTEGLAPYLKSDAVLSVRGQSFSYAPPSELNTSTMNDVAHTVLGTLSLPCATVTLYADGHVKSLPTANAR